MARARTARALTVWMNGERVATWTQALHGVEELAYAPEWLEAPAARPISLSLPLGARDMVFRGQPVSFYFDNLLPDSAQVRTRLQVRFAARSARPFDLLAEIGRDCVGAIQLLPDGEKPGKIKIIEGTRLTDSGVEQMLNTTLGRGPALATTDDFRTSLAGMQEKTALLWHRDRWWRPEGTTPSTHILKLPIGFAVQGIDLRTSVENEWLCAQILRAFGADVAECSMAQFGEHSVLVVKRFDRRLAADKSWIVRLPQEDICQALGVSGGQKYQADGGPGIQRIMRLLLGSDRAASDRREFLQTQLLFWMLCALDGHAKNFSIFLGAGGAYRMTPRYDVLSAHPVIGNTRGKLSPRKVKMAMSVTGQRPRYHWHLMQRRHWEETARLCGMASEFPSILTELVERTPEVVERVGALLPKSFPDAVAMPILDGLRRAARMLAG